jgi:hypothetical protein
MDKLEAIVHLIRAALSKARELNALTLTPDTRNRVAGIMKKTADIREKLETLAEPGRINGKLDKATLDRELDRILLAMDEINRTLDDLIAKSRS